MKRIRALLRTTWWLWLIYFGTAIALALFVDPTFWITVPILVFILVYFAFLRFDENGTRRAAS